MKPSRTYIIVRSRQLEGTFPGDAHTGAWCITALRINRGWGVPPESAWPYAGRAKAWPPMEPPNVDSLARPHRIWAYRRTRTLDECRAALANEHLVLVSLDITREWTKAPLGRIPKPNAAATVTGAHSILLVGYDDQGRVFRFVNSWGTTWGDRGYGLLPYDYFELLSDAWVMVADEGRSQLRRTAKATMHEWAVDASGVVVHGREFYDAENDETLAWCFIAERAGALDIEELFVRPDARHRGYGAEMCRAVNELAATKGLPLRLWVPYVDDTTDNQPRLAKVATRLGLVLVTSGVKWASRKGSEKSDKSPVVAIPGTIPRRPHIYWSATDTALDSNVK